MVQEKASLPLRSTVCEKLLAHRAGGCWPPEQLPRGPSSTVNTARCLNFPVRHCLSPRWRETPPCALTLLPGAQAAFPKVQRKSNVWDTVSPTGCQPCRMGQEEPVLRQRLSPERVPSCIAPPRPWDALPSPPGRFYTVSPSSLLPVSLISVCKCSPSEGLWLSAKVKCPSSRLPRLAGHCWTPGLHSAPIRSSSSLVSPGTPCQH